MDGSNNPSGLNLFTHQQQRDLEGTKSLVKDYEHLKLAVLELFLSVKIRSDDEIDDYDKGKFEQEKKELASVDGFTLIDNIKSAIEQLMNMKQDESGEVSLDGPRRQYNDTGDLDDDIEIDLPQGAKDGLKDATQNDMIHTDHMNEQLKKSLPLLKNNKNKNGQQKPPKLNGKKDEPIPGLLKVQDQMEGKQDPTSNNEAVDLELLKQLNQ